MSMPKGFKVERGYATVSGEGLGYREIAEKMSEDGFKMNHSTARNVFVSALSKIASSICDSYDKQLSEKEIKKIAIDPRFQEAVAEYMREIEHDRSQGVNK